MDKCARVLVRASFVYLGLGVVLGVMMVISAHLRFPAMVRVHTHILLLGSMLMMVYSFGYEVIPRLTGKPPYSQSLGTVQVWLANITLVGLSVCWIFEAVLSPFWHLLSVLFAVGQGIAVFLFILNLWMSLEA